MLAVKPRMRQTIVFQYVYASYPLRHIRVYAREHIKTRLEGVPCKFMIFCVLTPVNIDTAHVYTQHPIWG